MELSKNLDDCCAVSHPIMQTQFVSATVRKVCGCRAPQSPCCSYCSRQTALFCWLVWKMGGAECLSRPFPYIQLDFQTECLRYPDVYKVYIHLSYGVEQDRTQWRVVLLTAQASRGERQSGKRSEEEGQQWTETAKKTNRGKQTQEGPALVHKYIWEYKQEETVKG